MAATMNRYSYAIVTLGLFSVVIPLRAANGPHAGSDNQSKMIWTNNDLDKLHDLDGISIVGREDEMSASLSAPSLYVRTQDPNWYATEAAQLRGALEHRQAELREYQQAIDDARSLRESASGIEVDEDSAVTPEAGIDILQQRVSETQSELDALEDLARRNDILPGALRGQ
jgi:hypothetical protein